MELNKWDKQHLINLGLTQRQIDEIFTLAAKEAAAIGVSLDKFNPDKPFSFADYPQTKALIEKLTRSLQNNIEMVIVNGICSAWTLANNKNNVLCDRVFGENKYKLTKEQERKYYNNNDKAYNAFIKRKTAGLNLSDRVWNYTDQFKTEIEMGLDLGIRNGLSAAEMARDLKKYLKEPDKLFRRVRDEHGELQLSKNAKACNPGAGVYRSSYRNAIRLALTENNMAYRTSDYERWQQLDFVVGIEIILSNNHTLNGVSFTDICDELKGKYPKSFKFTGWHPQCRCFAVSILSTTDEFIASLDEKQGEFHSKNEITDVPENFKKWVADNKDRIEKANNRGTLPYFLKDNTNFAEISVNKINVVGRTELLKEAKEKYNSYNTNDWIQAGFDEFSGGYRVYHKEHQFDPTIGKFGISRGDYEKNTSEVLVKYGMTVELQSEKQEFGVKTPDGLLNGILFDIKGIEGNSHRIIKDVILKSSKQKAEIAVLYYHDKSLFDMDLVREGYGKYLANSKNKRVKKVYCVVEKYLYRI
jgi:predicted transposase YbfD/YdcC